MARTITPEDVFSEAERVMSKPFAWGERDCCSSSCAVFSALWGFDPMASVRGYSGAMGAGRLMSRFGGLLGLAQRLADDAGLRPGHKSGGLAISIDERSLLICIRPGLWAGKSNLGMALLREAGKGWHA